LAGNRQKSESSRAIQACNDYLRMGPSRSVAKLHRQYQKSAENVNPTGSMPTLHRWSQRYGWTTRAEDHDAKLETEKNERADMIMGTGLALTHERVDKLKSLGELLWEQMHEVGESGTLHNIWIPDVKQIGGGEYAERVDIEKFNGAIIQQYRDTLDDIAKETGGRPNKHELTGKDGGSIAVEQWKAAAEKQLAAAEDMEE